MRSPIKLTIAGQVDEVVAVMLLRVVADSARTSGADLTFAAHPAAGSQSECQIQSSTRNLYLLSGPLILTFARELAEKGCEC